MAATSGADVVTAAFASLQPEEQEEAFARISDVRLTRLGVDADATAYFLRSLRRVADVAGPDLSPDLYRATRRQLLAADEDIAEFNAVTRHFGSWRAAKEAAALAEVTTATKIEARFRARVVGRPWFREDELEEALRRCATDLGRTPLVAEYHEWRLKELALARTRGEQGRLPSASVFRRRHGSWEGALLACGYDPDEVYLRLEPHPGRRYRVGKVDRYSDATLKESLLRCVADLGRVPLVEEYGAWRKAKLTQPGSEGVPVPTDSPYRRRFGSWERALIGLGLDEAEVAARLAPGRVRSTQSRRPA